MSHPQFHCLKLFILRLAWLNLWDKHMTTGRINQVIILFIFLFVYMCLQDIRKKKKIDSFFFQICLSFVCRTFHSYTLISRVEIKSSTGCSHFKRMNLFHFNSHIYISLTTHITRREYISRIICSFFLSPFLSDDFFTQR